MEQIALLLSRIKSHKYRSQDEGTIRLLLAAQTPETTAVLVRAALWNVTDRYYSIWLTPSKYEEILRRDLFRAVRCLSECKIIEPTLAADIADALITICLDGEDWNDPSPLRGKAWDHLAYVKTNTIGTLVFAQTQRALSDERLSVQLNAAKALGQAGQDIGASLEVVHAILKHPKPHVKIFAANSIKVIGQASPDILALLREAVKERLIYQPVRAGLKYAIEANQENLECAWRWTAVEVLGAFQTSAPWIVPILIEALHDEDFMVRVYAARALGTSSQPTEEVLQSLISALPDPILNTMANASVGDWGNYGAAEALGTLTATIPLLQARMFALLHNDNVYVRGGAAKALGATYIHSEELLDALSSAALDKEWAVRYQALEALARIGQSNDRIVDVCLSAVNDSQWMVGWIALQALGKIKPASEKGKLALLKAAQNPYPGIRRIAAEAFGHLGDTSLEIITVLRVLINSEDTAVEAATTLLKLGRESIEVHRALLRGLQHEYEEVRLPAAKAMASLTIPSLEIENGLTDALQDRDEEVRFAAWQSLWIVMLRQSDNLTTQK
jgi:HEAT repeat protein